MLHSNGRGNMPQPFIFNKSLKTKCVCGWGRESGAYRSISVGVEDTTNNNIILRESMWTPFSFHFSWLKTFPGIKIDSNYKQRNIAKKWTTEDLHVESAPFCSNNQTLEVNRYPWAYLGDLIVHILDSLDLLSR